MNNKTDIYQDGEIDLIRLLEKAWKGIFGGIKWLLELLAKFIVLLFRSWKQLVLAAFASILLTLIVNLFAKDIFYREITLTNNAADNSELIAHINRLNGFIKTGNTSTLADELKISDNEAATISRAEAFWIVDRNADGIPDYTDLKKKHNPYDTVNVRMRDRIALVLEARNPENLENITDRVVDYINTDESFRLKNSVRLSNINELIGTYEYEIELLDSIQKVLLKRNDLQPSPTAGQIVLLENQEIQLLHVDINDLLEKKQRLVTEKEIYNDPVTVISKPGAAIKISSLGHYVGIIMPATIGLVIIFLIYRRLRDNIRKLIEKYS